MGQFDHIQLNHFIPAFFPVSNASFSTIKMSKIKHKKNLNLLILLKVFIQIISNLMFEIYKKNFFFQNISYIIKRRIIFNNVSY